MLYGETCVEKSKNDAYKGWCLSSVSGWMGARNLF